jgi:phosphatidylserine synthase
MRGQPSGDRCASKRVAAFEVEERESAFGGVTVLWTIFVVLLVLWLLGIVSSYTLGGFIHLLLLLALVVLVLQLISGRRPVV